MQAALLQNFLQCRLLSYRIFCNAGCSPIQNCLQCRLLSYTGLFTVQTALYRTSAWYYQLHSSVNRRCQQFVNKLIANINCNGSLSSCLGTISTLYNSFATFWQKVGVRNRDTKIISVMLRLRKWNNSVLRHCAGNLHVDCGHVGSQEWYSICCIATFQKILRGGFYQKKMLNFSVLKTARCFNLWKPKKHFDTIPLMAWFWLVVISLPGEGGEGGRPEN